MVDGIFSLALTMKSVAVFRRRPTITNISAVLLLTLSSSTIGHAAPSSNTSERSPTICTHDGDFHADEVIGCYMLLVLYPKAKLIRTRDPAILKTCDIVLDVGKVYDPRQYLYDHHQPDFAENMYSVSPELKSHIRLSSAGLIYHHYGRAVIEKLTNETNPAAVDYVYTQVYYSVIQELDAIDNGIPRYDSDPLYYVCSGLSSRISRLNKPFIPPPDWNETVQFYKAMAIAGEEFRTSAINILKYRYPARKIVREAIGTRYQLHYSGQIIDLSESCPWKGHFSELEKRYRIQPPIIYVIFPLKESYRVQCVANRGQRYGCRKPLPESWRGLSDENLSKVVGIEGCIFAHASGFTAAHKTRDGALQMAIMSLEAEEAEKT